MIGRFARPRRVLIVPDMPKTRSGKLMRRVLAALFQQHEHWRHHNVANPDVVEKVRVGPGQRSPWRWRMDPRSEEIRDGGVRS